MACEKHVGIRFSYCFHTPILKMTHWYEMNSHLKTKVWGATARDFWWVAFLN